MIPSGAVLIDKECGITSFDVIRKLKKLRHPSLQSLGHTGTLDPFASGLLIVLFGRATKLSSYLTLDQKTYEAEIVFGVKTDSGDVMGKVVSDGSKLPTNSSEIQAAANSFLSGEYWQTPPMTSAKKVDGQKLYELARRGETIERKSELRKVYEFEILNYEAPLVSALTATAHARVTCSSGTYVRVLAEDLAEKLGGAAYLKNLRRTSISQFSVNGSVSSVELSSLEILEKSPCVLSIEELIANRPQIELTAAENQKLIFGQKEVLVDIAKRIGEIFENDKSLKTSAKNEVVFYGMFDSKLAAIFTLLNGTLDLKRVCVGDT